MPQAIKFNVIGQPIETLSFETLTELLDNSKPIDRWFMDKFFPDVRLLNGTSQVPVGEITSVIPVAPAVSPKVQGRVIRSKREANVSYIKAPYFKPAEVVEPSTDVDAKMLELMQKFKVISPNAQGQVMSIADQWTLATAVAFDTVRQSLNARIVLMCRDALLFGKIDVDGDDDSGVEVDFGRHADLTFAPAIKWGQAGAKPYQDQKAMVKALIAHGKQSPTDAIMSSRVYDTLGDDKEFNEKFTAAQNTLATRVFSGTFGGQIEATLRGTVDGINYWTYDQFYEVENADGSVHTERLIPEDGFWFISETRNRLYFTQIVHRLNPNRLAYREFPYHVSNDDPSIDKFIVDCSPLPVPVNKNGACGGTGFIEL